MCFFFCLVFFDYVVWLLGNILKFVVKDWFNVVESRIGIEFC